MKRRDLITSDEYIKATTECIIRSGRPVNKMRPEMDKFIIELKNELISPDDKDREIERLESENRITESQLINANEEIERLKGLIEKLFKDDRIEGSIFSDERIEKKWQQFKTDNQL